MPLACSITARERLSSSTAAVTPACSWRIAAAAVPERGRAQRRQAIAHGVAGEFLVGQRVRGDLNQALHPLLVDPVQMRRRGAAKPAPHGRFGPAHEFGPQQCDPYPKRSPHTNQRNAAMPKSPLNSSPADFSIKWMSRSSAHPWQLIPAARTAAATGRYGDTVIRALTDLAVPTWGHEQSSLQMRSAVQHAVASVLANDDYPQCGRC